MKVAFDDHHTLGDYKNPGGDDLPRHFQITLLPENSEEATRLLLWNMNISAILKNPNSKLEIHRVGQDTDLMCLEFHEKKR